jgi:rare lipoprotein A
MLPELLGEDRIERGARAAARQDGSVMGADGMAYMRRNDEGAAASRLTITRIRSGLAPRTLQAPALVVTAAVVAASLGGCASTQSAVSSSVSGLSPTKSASREPMFPESKWGVTASRRVAGHDERIPKGGGRYKVGEPYQVGGRWYNPREQPDYDRVGVASWYGSDFHGRHTANGEVFDMHALTAAHPTLPMPSYAYVTNTSNGRTILVRVNDRGPYVGERMIDLSRESARSLGLLSGGTGKVRVRYAGPAPLDGNDRRERQFLASRSWTGGSDIAALERTESQREWADHRSASRQETASFASPVATASYTERPGVAPSRLQPASRWASAEPARPRSYADAGLGGAWSPYSYRSAQKAR